MDMEAVKFGFQVLQFLLWGGTSFYVYMSNKNKVTNDRISELQRETNKQIESLQHETDTKMDDHSERIARIEALAEKAPTHEDIGKVYDKINQVSDCVSRLEGEFAGATRTLQLIHETLMERK